MDFFAFAIQNARQEFPVPQQLSQAEYEAYVFECDADLAQTAEAQRMRASFNQATHCRYCLFMRDMSVLLQADGSCAVCAMGGR